MLLEKITFLSSSSLRTTFVSRFSKVIFLAVFLSVNILKSVFAYDKAAKNESKSVLLKVLLTSSILSPINMIKSKNFY